MQVTFKLGEMRLLSGGDGFGKSLTRTLKVDLLSQYLVGTPLSMILSKDQLSPNSSLFQVLDEVL